MRLTRKLKGLACSHRLLRAAIRSVVLPKREAVPAEVAIETTNACNLDCVMCPRRGMDRPIHPMDFALFQKLVREAHAIGVSVLKLHHYGEPLLLPTEVLDRQFAFIREQAPHIYIHLVTNATLLRGERAELLLKYRIDQVSITIDGVTPETYAHIRRGGNLTQVERNVKEFIELKRRKDNLPFVSVGMIRQKESEHELDAFRENWTGVADEVRITGYSTRGGTLPRYSDAPSRPIPCFRLWRQLVVCNTGYAALCCTDWNCEYVLGDLNTQTILDVWQGENLRAYRWLHATGRRDDIPICRECFPEKWETMPTWWY